MPQKPSNYLLKIGRGGYLGEMNMHGLRITVTKKVIIVHRMIADNIYYYGSEPYNFWLEFYSLHINKNRTSAEEEFYLYVKDVCNALISYPDNLYSDFSLLNEITLRYREYFEKKLIFYKTHLQKEEDENKIEHLWAEWYFADMMKRIKDKKTTNKKNKQTKHV